jgi:transcription elongation GreA/GreB family factor
VVRALLGMAEGEHVQVALPRGSRGYTVLSVG